MSAPLRVFVSGEQGAPYSLCEALRSHADLELTGDAGAADVVVFCLDGGPFPRSELRALAEAAQAPIVLVAERADSGLLEEALEAEVADVVVLPQAAERLAFTVRKAARSAARQGGGGRRARVLTVFSPKGGTGKTVISSNLAAHLAKELGLRTLLVDLDVQFGDAAIMLGLEPEQTLHDLASAPGELDADKLRGYLTAHARTGMDVLAAPLRPEDGELVSEVKVDRVLETAKLTYDVIVVDTSPSFHGPMLSALDHSDTLLLVCNPEVPTLKNVRLGIETLKRLAFPEERMKLVLNRADPGAGMRGADVEAALGMPVSYELPRTREVPEAVNRGLPLVLMSPSLAFSKAVQEMSRSLTDGAAKPAPAVEPSGEQDRGSLAGAVRGLTTGWLPRRAGTAKGVT